jgi:protein disulfide-isomerase
VAGMAAAIRKWQPDEEDGAMKKVAWIAAACIVAAALTAVLVSPALAGDWDYFSKTYAAAEKVAKAEGKPLYLHFTTTWCGWCRKIEKDIYSAEEGKKALSPFACATLDCTEPKDGEPSADVKFNLDLMKKYGGQGYPFLVMMTPDGVLLHSFAGYKPLPAFKEELAVAEKNFKKFRDFDAYAAKADKAGLEYNLKAMDLYSSTGAWAKAGEAAEVVKKLDPKAEKSDAAVVAFSILQAAEERKDPAEKVQPLEEEVLKADPKNEKGYMEKVLFGRAQELLAGAGRGPNRDKAKLEQAAAALQMLLDKAAKVSDKTNVYGFMGFIQFQAGKFDEAIASMQKARELEAGGARAATFDRYVEAIKKAKAAAASQPAATKPAEPKPAEK